MPWKFNLMCSSTANAKKRWNFTRRRSARTQMMMRFKEAPDKSMISPGVGNKVMHAQVQIGDAWCWFPTGAAGQNQFPGLRLDDLGEERGGSEKMFSALGEGGQVTMPMAKTFFSPRFGMLADKFGVGWMVLVAQ